MRGPEEATSDDLGRLQIVWPEPATDVPVHQAGRPAVLFFWNPSAPIAREEVVTLDRVANEDGLLDGLDLLAVAGTTSGGLSDVDVRDVAALLDLGLPVAVDPGGALATRLGAQPSLDLLVIGAAGEVLGRELVSVEQTRLASPGRPGALDARTWLREVARQGDGPKLAHPAAWSATEVWIGHRVPDLVLVDVTGGRRGLRARLGGVPTALLVLGGSAADEALLGSLSAVPSGWDVVAVVRAAGPGRDATVARLVARRLPFPLLVDDGALGDLLRVPSTAASTLLLGPDGTVAAVLPRPPKDLATELVARLPEVARTPPGTERAPPTGWGFPLSLRDEDGVPVELAAMEGTPMALHFWATWCGPCVAELPALLARREALDAAGELVLVSLDTDAGAIRRFRSKTGLAFETLLAPTGGVADRLDLRRSVPRTYVLDGHGGLRQVLRGTYDWADDDQLGRVLGRLH